MSQQKEPDLKTSRWFRIAIWVLIGLVTLWIFAMFRFIVYPNVLSPAERIQSVDAVYVLGMATNERLARGIEMMQEGKSDQLVVTVTPDNRLTQFCAADHSYTVHCVSPDPVTTQGEARQWAELSEQHQWDSVALVTMRSHATRSQLTFESCYAGAVRVVDDQAHEFSAAEWFQHFIYETGAMIKLALTRGC